MGSCVSVLARARGRGGAQESDVPSVPLPDVATLDLEELLHLGIAEAQLATVAKKQRERLERLHSAKTLLTAALRRCGQRDPNLCAHLSAVLFKLGEDARTVQGILAECGSSTAATPSGTSSTVLAAEAARAGDVRSEAGADAANIEVTSEHSSERGGDPGGPSRLWEYDELKEGLLHDSDEELSPEPVSSQVNDLASEPTSPVVPGTESPEASSKPRAASLSPVKEGDGDDLQESPRSGPEVPHDFSGAACSSSTEDAHAEVQPPQPTHRGPLEGFLGRLGRGRSSGDQHQRPNAAAGAGAGGGAGAGAGEAKEAPLHAAVGTGVDNLEDIVNGGGKAETPSAAESRGPAGGLLGRLKSACSSKHEALHERERSAEEGTPPARTAAASSILREPSLAPGLGLGLGLGEPEVRLSESCPVSPVCTKANSLNLPHPLLGTEDAFASDSNTDTREALKESLARFKAYVQPQQAGVGGAHPPGSSKRRQGRGQGQGQGQGQADAQLHLASESTATSLSLSQGQTSQSQGQGQGQSQDPAHTHTHTHTHTHAHPHAHAHAHIHSQGQGQGQGQIQSPHVSTRSRNGKQPSQSQPGSSSSGSISDSDGSVAAGRSGRNPLSLSLGLGMGAKDGSSHLAAACACGHAFTLDSVFCRMCGRKRPPETPDAKVNVRGGTFVPPARPASASASLTATPSLSAAVPGVEEGTSPAVMGAQLTSQNLGALRQQGISEVSARVPRIPATSPTLQVASPSMDSAIGNPLSRADLFRPTNSAATGGGLTPKCCAASPGMNHSVSYEDFSIAASCAPSLPQSGAASVAQSPFIGAALGRSDLTPLSPAATAPDTLRVRILNGVSGEEEISFPMSVQGVWSSEQHFLSSLDRQCQQQTGQPLSRLNWLSQAQPGSRFQRRKCDSAMVEDLFGRSGEQRRAPAVLLLCTVPVRPPSELAASKVRLRNLLPAQVALRLGAAAMSDPVRVHLDTSPLEVGHEYTVAFTHQWSNMTHVAEAVLLPSGRGVEAVVPWQMLGSSSQMTEGLYDVHLVIDGALRSENRRTLTVGSAESELSSSSVSQSCSASSFVPIGKGHR